MKNKENIKLIGIYLTALALIVNLLVGQLGWLFKATKAGDARLESRLSSIEQTVGEHDTCINGNGKQGIKERLVGIETNMATLSTTVSQLHENQNKRFTELRDLIFNFHSQQPKPQTRR